MSRDEKLDPLAIISKLAAAEQDLTGKVFLAPVLKNASTHCRDSLRTGSGNRLRWLGAFARGKFWSS
jgi:hypothetical protein